METKECPRCSHEIIVDLSLCPFCDYDWSDPDKPVLRKEEDLSKTKPVPPISEKPELLLKPDTTLRTAYRQHPRKKEAARRALRYLLLVSLFGIAVALYFTSRPLGRQPSPPEFATSPEAGDRTLPPEESLEEAWESRAEQWSRVMKDSGVILKAGRNGVGTPPPPGARDSRKATAAPGPPGKGEKLVEVVALDASIRSGDSVDILWISPDGAIWQKVLDRPVVARDISGNRARVSVAPDDARKIASARNRGEVYAVPR